MPASVHTRTQAGKVSDTRPRCTQCNRLYKPNHNVVCPGPRKGSIQERIARLHYAQRQYDACPCDKHAQTLAIVKARGGKR